MSPSLAILLREHEANQEFNRMLLGKPLLSNELVSSDPDGSPLQPDSITKAFTRIARSSGLHGVRFHDLRHTRAALALRRGIHPRIVSKRFGHSSVAITLDTYSHIISGMQEDMMALLDEVLPLGKSKKDDNINVYS